MGRRRELFRPIHKSGGYIFHLQPYLVQNSLPALPQPRRRPHNFGVVFLECGGETVKGVHTVPESVSTQAVVLLYQVHDAVTASHCLLQTPFRYCAHLLLLCLLLLLSFFLSISVSSDGLQTDGRTRPGPSLPQTVPSSHAHIGQICTNLTPNHMVCFLLFLTSCTPTPSLSSAPGVCIQCFPHTCLLLCATPALSTHPLTHTHTYTHTHTEIQAHEQTTTHRTSQLLQFFFVFFHCRGPEKCSHKPIYRNSFVALRLPEQQ